MTILLPKLFKIALESRDDKGTLNFKNHNTVIQIFKQMHRHYV